MDIQLFTIESGTNKVVWGIKAKAIEKVPFLIQRVVVSLMNVPGQDVLEPMRGGGVPELVGYNIDIEKPSGIFSELARRIKKTQAEILADQIGSTALPEEKLSSLEIIEITQSEQIDEVNARIRIVNQAGQQTDIVL